MGIRYKAAAIHLSISAVIAVLVMGGMFAIWYPPPLFEAMGAGFLIFVLVGVDVVLGPLVTLIIFNPKKAVRLLKLDLTVIGLLQLSALAYGVYVVAEARPAYVVFVKDRFEVTAADEIPPDELAKVTRPEFKTIPKTGPVVVAAPLPKDPAEFSRIMTASIGGTDLKSFPQHYVPIDTQLDAVRKAAQPLEALRRRRGKDEGTKPIDEGVRKSGVPESELGYLPLRARNRDMSVLIDKRSGRIAGYAAVSPW